MTVVEHRYRVPHLDVEPVVFHAALDEASARRTTVRAVLLAWLRERAVNGPWCLVLPCEGCGELVTVEGDGPREDARRSWADGTLVAMCPPCKMLSRAFPGGVR